MTFVQDESQQNIDDSQSVSSILNSPGQQKTTQLIQQLEWQVQYEKDLGMKMQVILENKLSE